MAFGLAPLLRVSTADAGDVAKLSPSPTQKAEERVLNFLGMGSRSHVHYLEDLEVRGWAATHLVLKIALARLAEPEPLPIRTENRIHDLIQFLAKSAQSAGPLPAPAGLKSAVTAQANTMLEQFVSRNRNPAVMIELFDHLDLWNAKAFWFFERNVTHTTALREHLWRIEKLIPELDATQLDRFADQLRHAQLDDFWRLSLLLNMSRIQSDELALLFVLAARRFVEKSEALALGRRFTEIVPGAKKTDSVYAQALNILMVVISMENPTVMSAYHFARESFVAQKPSAKRDTALRFFDLLLDTRFDWMNPATWQSGPAYAVDGRILHVDFSPNGRCEKDLE